MKRGTLLCGPVVAVAILFVAGQVVSQDEDAKPDAAEQQGTREMDAMMQQRAKHAQPGEHHARLRPFVGRWNLTVRSMMTPGQPVQEDTGTAEYKWILGGRYLLEEIHGSSTPEGGTPFEGMGIHGYDNLKQNYFAMWVDNTTTGLFTFEGTCDASGKVFTLAGEDTDPTTGKPIKVRSVLRIVDENKWVSETYVEAPDGKEVKAVELTYTRKK